MILYSPYFSGVETSSYNEYYEKEKALEINDCQGAQSLDWELSLSNT